MIQRVRELARRYSQVGQIPDHLRIRLLVKARLLGWIWLTLAGLVLAAALAAPTVTGNLDAQRIRADRGAAYTAYIPTRVGRLYTVHGDLADRPKSGPMTLAENGFPLGPADAGLDHIRASG